MNSNLIKNIQRLQFEIQKILKISNKENDAFYLNLSEKTIKKLTPEITEMYKESLEFIFNSTKNFFSVPERISVSYSVPNLTAEEQELFDKKVESYANYNDLEKLRKEINSRKTSKYLSVEELFNYNQHHIRKFMKDKDYDEYQPQYILWQFQLRVSQMESCIKKYENQPTKKTPREIIYYQMESKRERIILESIKQKLTETAEQDKSDVLRDELKKMGNYILWGLKDFFCYHNEENGTLKTPEEFNVQINSVIEKLQIAQQNDPDNCVKKMMTFLPLEIFEARSKQSNERINLNNIDNNSTEYEYTYNETKLRAFLMEKIKPRDYKTEEEKPIEEGGIIKPSQIQFRLGIGYDLMGNIKNKAYAGITELWGVYLTFLDLYNSCGKFGNYSIYLNLLEMYMSAIQKDSIFPVSFSFRNEQRPDTTNSQIWNVATDTYDFRYKDPIKKESLFNNDVKFLGVHFIKYRNDKGNLTAYPLFIFLNKKYKENSQKPRIDTVTTIGYDFISSYTGNDNEIFICDRKMYFVEEGEISPSMSLTYHEFTNMLYYGARMYIFGDDRKELYFTLLPRENEELQKLITLLNMKEVFIVKGKVDTHDRERFAVETIEEAKAHLNEFDVRLMGKQQLLVGVNNQESQNGGAFSKYNQLSKINKKMRMQRTKKIKMRMKRTKKIKMRMKIKPTKKLI